MGNFLKAISNIGMASGNPIGEGIGAGVSILDTLFGGDNGKKKADSLLPSETDPMQLSFFDEMNRKRKSFSTGTAFANDLSQLGETQANTNRGIISAGGGAGGATITGLLRGQMGTNQAYGDITDKAKQYELSYDNMTSKLLEDITNRRLGIQTARYSQAQADARQANQTGLENLFGSSTQLGSVLGEVLGNLGGGSKTPTVLNGGNRVAGSPSTPLSNNDFNPELY